MNFTSNSQTRSYRAFLSASQKCLFVEALSTKCGKHVMLGFWSYSLLCFCSDSFCLELLPTFGVALGWIASPGIMVVSGSALPMESPPIISSFADFGETVGFGLPRPDITISFYNKIMQYDSDRNQKNNSDHFISSCSMHPLSKLSHGILTPILVLICSIFHIL